MKFGLQMLVSTKHYVPVAEAAEASGFTSLHVPDHLVYPDEIPATYPYADDGVLRINGERLLVGNIPCYDPFGLLCFLAARTTTVELVPSVCIVPLYHPIALARSLATVDRLSGGRVALGVGVGWLRAEFDAVGLGFTDRGRRTDATIEILRRLWTEEVVTHQDEWFDFGPVRFNPKPFGRPSIPVYVGGDSIRALERAGRVGDGWLDIGSTSLEDVGDKLAIVQEARRRAERADRPFEVVTTSTVVSSTDAVRRAADLGVTRVIAIPAPGEPGLGSLIDWIQAYGRDVISTVGPIDSVSR